MKGHLHDNQKKPPPSLLSKISENKKEDEIASPLKIKYLHVNDVLHPKHDVEMTN